VGRLGTALVVDLPVPLPDEPSDLRVRQGQGSPLSPLSRPARGPPCSIVAHFRPPRAPSMFNGRHANRGRGRWPRRAAPACWVWADIAPEYEADYFRRYDEEHLAHLLAIPGFLSAGVYLALKGAPNISPSTNSRPRMRCAPQRSSTGSGFGPRRSASAPRAPRRAKLPAQRLPPDLPDQDPRDRNDTGAGSVPADGTHRHFDGDEQEFNDWYDTAYIPPYLACPGCLGVRAMSQSIANPST
jgi:hypothetical protein